MKDEPVEKQKYVDDVGTLESIPCTPHAVYEPRTVCEMGCYYKDCDGGHNEDCDGRSYEDYEGELNVLLEKGTFYLTKI